MPDKKPLFAMTLDLEADFSGALHEEYSLLESMEKLRVLMEFFRERDVKLSLFVVGRLIEKYPEAIELFRGYGCEFHCHSYSHDPAATDSEEEIRRCREVFLNYFGSAPLGYRAPDGRITPQGIKNLEAYGFHFDASIFPSYYPNPFKYLFRRSRPHRVKGTQIIEVPNTPVSPFRVMLSISYVKLLGIGPFRSLLKISRLPRVVVFGSHLHDFFIDPGALVRMPRWWRFIYGRNRDLGLEYLDVILEYFRRRGYQFCVMSEILEDTLNVLNKEDKNE